MAGPHNSCWRLSRSISSLVYETGSSTVIVGVIGANGEDVLVDDNGDEGSVDIDEAELRVRSRRVPPTRVAKKSRVPSLVVNAGVVSSTCRIDSVSCSVGRPCSIVMYSGCQYSCSHSA